MRMQVVNIRLSLSPQKLARNSDNHLMNKEISCPGSDSYSIQYLIQYLIKIMCRSKEHYVGTYQICHKNLLQNFLLTYILRQEVTLECRYFDLIILSGEVMLEETLCSMQWCICTLSLGSTIYIAKFEALNLKHVRFCWLPMVCEG